jgi:hypothetical protein
MGDTYCTACDMTTNDKQRCLDCPRRNTTPTDSSAAGHGLSDSEILAEAARQLKLHNQEYGHRTAPAFIDHLIARAALAQRDAGEVPVATTRNRWRPLGTTEWRDWPIPSYVDRFEVLFEHVLPSARPAPAGEPAGDNWQQYAKEGESAQQCIERHRGELNSFMTLYINKGKA